MAPPAANTGDSGTGFLSGLKQVLIPDSQPPRSHTRTPSNSTPTTTQDYGSQAVSNVLVDLAPRLVSSSARMLHPNTISSHQATLAASSSSQQALSSDPKALSLRRKLSYVRAGLALGRANNPLQSWTDLSTQLYLRDRVDELLALPVPAAPFSLASTSSTTAAAGLAAIEAPPTANNPPRPDDPVPLIQGFLATVPAAQASKAERRRRRAEVSEKALGLSGGTRLGLRQRGERARGLLLDGIREGEEDEDEMGGRREGGVGAPSTIGRRTRARRKPAASGGDPSASDASTSAVPLETRADLEKDAREVAGDMNNVAVRRALLNGQIKDVEGKIAALEKVREDLRRGLLGLREEELELEDELEGIQSRLQRLPLDTAPALTTNQASAVALGGAAATPGQHARSDSASRLPTSSSRRRKGPAFLPSEHDDLPPNVAFMTLAGHLSPVIALDFTEPYGTLVSSSSDSSVRLWDLTTGTETGFLKGHKGLVKALQVEGNVCVSGGEDGGIRVWDLDKAEEMFYAGIVPGSASSSSTFPVVPVEEDVFGPTGTIGAGGLVNGAAGSNAEDDGLLREATSIRDGTTDATPLAGETSTDPTDPCMRNLQGHTKSVTSLFFDGSTLVTGSSDSTLRQWDLTTGQCVQTMDILWAISNPLPASSVLYPASSYSHSANDPFALSFSQPGSGGSDFGGFGSASSSPPITPRKAYASSLRRQSSLFESPGAMAAPTTATYADGSWELYDDFVGGVMFWGYALASGTKDGCVRMWDMRTGQAHRTLVGHTGPVTCLQFDEYHLVSGSLDRTIRIWDLRTGAIADTLRYDHAVTSLQFDSRKVVAAAAENGVKVYNRTTMEHSSLQLNGHTAPAEKLRFMDRYLATGGRDAMVKIWALQ